MPPLNAGEPTLPRRAMPLTYNIDVPSWTVRVNGTGELTAEDFADYFRRSRGESTLSPDMWRVIDWRDVTAFPSGEEIRTLSNTLMISGSCPQARVAVVVRSDLAFGVAMMFAGLCGITDQVRAVRDEKLADEWIRSGTLPD